MEEVESYLNIKPKYRMNNGYDKLVEEQAARIDELERALTAIKEHQETNLHTMCNNSQVYSICVKALKSK